MVMFLLEYKQKYRVLILTPLLINSNYFPQHVHYLQMSTIAMSRPCSFYFAAIVRKASNGKRNLKYVFSSRKEGCSFFVHRADGVKGHYKVERGQHRCDQSVWRVDL